MNHTAELRHASEAQCVPVLSSIPRTPQSAKPAARERELQVLAAPPRKRIPPPLAESALKKFTAGTKPLNSMGVRPKREVVRQSCWMVRSNTF